MATTSDWKTQCAKAAAGLVSDWADFLVERLVGGKVVSPYYSDYPDGDEMLDGIQDDFFNSTDVDDAALFILNYWNCRETDYGLWSNREPLDAVMVQAAWTYRSVVAGEVMELLKEIANDADLYELLNPSENDGGCTPTRESEVDEAAIRRRIKEICDEFA